MSEVKISADLTDAIEKLSEKLGIAADAIIPEYEKNIRINGIVWIIAGIITGVLPWVILPQPFEYHVASSYDVDWGMTYSAIRWIACIGMTFIGFYISMSYIENLITSKAIAINRLMNQITKD